MYTYRVGREISGGAGVMAQGEIRPRGRGAGGNPKNRFESTHHEIDWTLLEDDPDSLASASKLATTFLPDSSRTIITSNESPDVGFDVSINPYRGCEHGCVYCYARPTHEYLGYSAGLDFESKILVKHDAPALLRRELASPDWKPRVLGMSGVTDAYQPIERKLMLTRRCLEVLVEFRQAVAVITKNKLVVRDLDLLSALAHYDAAGVFLSVTTLEDELAGKLEPRTSRPRARLEAVVRLADAGIPVGVMVAPVIPGLNDHEIPAILRAAAEAGAQYAGYTLVRLPLGVADLFSDWLGTHAPGAKEKILGRIRGARQGKLNESRFGVRMRGEGAGAEAIAGLFRTSTARLGLNRTRWPVSPAAFRRPNEGPVQQLLFS